MDDTLDEDFDDFESFDGEDLEEPPKPTLSDILLTAEEKQARKEYRMAASICCVNEAWRMYRRVTNTENAIEPANLSLEGSNPQMVTHMGVLYDPTAGLRMRFLKKKFAHLLDGFAALKQAAYRPFIRCQRPKNVDTDGQGFAMPKVVKAFYPEVYVTYKHPSTFAYKEKWSKTFNSNFVSAEDILRDQDDRDTQTMQADVYSTKRIRRKDKQRDTTVEQFDLEDIPLDNDGNPIGRSVGICEWCCRSILPIPSEHTLRVEWNIDALYCCAKYRLFIEEITKTTKTLEAEAEKKRFLIETKPRDNKIGKKVEKPNKKNANKPLPETATAKNKAMVGKMIQILQEKYTAATTEERKLSVGVDTSDLPWDPAETRYYQQQRANAEIGGNSPTGGRNTLANIDILLGLEEVYDKKNTSSGGSAPPSDSVTPGPGAATPTV